MIAEIFPCEVCYSIINSHATFFFTYESKETPYYYPVVLHNISIYRIDIECEPKTDYKKCLGQHRITSKIDIE